MIILDTNVASEMMRGHRAAPAVRAWVRHLHERPWITAITRGEIMAGIAYLPGGERRALLAAGALEVFGSVAGVLPYSDESTDAFAAIAASRRAAGHVVGTADTQIAAIALTYGATVATRNTKDFAGIGLTLVDPWES